jgi:hypothetical protein
MQCGVETMNDCERSPGRTGLRVNFTDKGEVKERREKFLTAKYGTHQMSLIRKRLAVEMWLYDELQKLFDPPVSTIHSTCIHMSHEITVYWINYDLSKWKSRQSRREREKSIKLLSSNHFWDLCFQHQTSSASRNEMEKENTTSKRFLFQRRKLIYFSVILD